jgi:hypothetical protein
MTPETAVRRAIRAAHERLKIDPCGVRGASKAAEQAACAVLQQYLTAAMQKRGMQISHLLYELRVAAFEVEDEDDQQGTLEAIQAIADQKA